jgi:transcriptional regulator with XRE-family HTH domain
MLQNNIRSLRKKCGLSQEELGIELNTVRQTISKWENGISVPDAETLVKLANIFHVSVSELLETNMQLNDVDDKAKIAEQLARLNEQIAIQNARAARIWKIVAGILLFVLMSFLLIAFLNYVPA